MRIESLRVISYRSWRVDEVSGPAARERLRCLELFAGLRAEGCSEKACLKAIGWSWAKYFRWRKRYLEDGMRGLESRSRRPQRGRGRRWTAADEARVLALRDAQPLWASARLARRFGAMWRGLI